MTRSSSIIALLAALGTACTVTDPANEMGEHPDAAPGHHGDGGSNPEIDASEPHGGPDAGLPSSSNIKIIVEPSDGAEALITAIQGAHTSLHMTMYLLTNTTITNALITLHKNNVDVRVVLNQTFPDNMADNATPYNALKAAGVDVVYSSTAFTYTHEKCVIIDGTVAWIMTMNATVSSPTDNREYLAIDTNAADIAEAETIFEADLAHTTPTLTGNLLVAPINARPGLLSLIATATSTIDVEGEEFSDSDIASALATAAGKKIKVRVVVSNETPEASETSAIATVKAKGAKVVMTSVPYIHAKTLIVDGARAYVGSANFSTGSLLYNRELGLITTDTTEIAKIETALNADFAAGTAQ